MARIALYARVSTRDKDQNPETQLLPMREYVARTGDTAVEYVDLASATDLPHRTAWRQVLQDARLGKVDLILVWRMDSAFRSVLHAAQTLEQLKHWGVALKSLQEAWLDTTSPMGEMMYYITIAYAQLERSLISERVKAGMERTTKGKESR
jgi:DNA invertase Pin-like site-specific DNA recombinase